MLSAPACLEAFRPLLGVVHLWILLLLAPSVQAHEFWLVANKPAVSTGQEVDFGLRIGNGWPGQPSSRLANLVDWFNAYDQRGVRPVEGRDGSLSLGQINARDAGALLVALRSNPARTTLSADEFNQYLSEEGLSDALTLRERYELLQSPAREQYSRCAKSILLVDNSSVGFDGLTGLPLELQLLSDPLKLKPGDPIRLQLLLHGEPLVGTLVKAQAQDQPGQLVSAVSDDNGRISLNLNSKGIWLFSAVYIEPRVMDGVDWESLWTSLTLDIPG